MNYHKAAVNLLEIFQVIHKQRCKIRIFDFLRSETLVLCFIAFNNEDVTPGSISKEMNVSSARIAVALNNLESKGFISRRVDKNDRRRILVEITTEGQDVVNKFQSFALQHLAEVLRLLGEEDAQEFIRITARLAEITTAWQAALPETSEVA